MATNVRSRTLRATALACVAAATLVGCGPEPARESERVAPSVEAAGSGITIALLPERNVFAQKKRYQPLEGYLAAALGRPVTFKLLDNYQQIFSELSERRVDGAFFGSMNGAIAQIKGAVEVLARPVELSGVSTYSGVLFANDGNGLTKDPGTWRGRRIALVNKVTTAGYLYPLSLLRSSGYAGDVESYFGQVTFTGSHDAAIIAVFGGQADLGACKNTVYEEYTRLHPEVQRKLTVLDVSAQVPSNALGVRPDLDPALKRQLLDTLVGMGAREDGQRALRQFQAQRFVATSTRDYEPVFAMARQAGVDLAAWPLREIH